MTSKIPKARHAVAIKSPEPTLLTLEDAYKSMNTMGGPALSLGEFGRLYQGSFGEALSYTLDGLRGRQRSVMGRHQIQLLLDDASSKNKTFNTEMEALNSGEISAKSRFENAKQSVKTTRNQLEEKITFLATSGLTYSEREISDLQVSIDRKKRTNFLLHVLEEKEKIRLSRFQEIAKLIEALKFVISWMRATERGARLAEQPTLPDLQQSISVCPSAQNTLDTLASCNDSPGDLELRLRHIIVQKAGSGAAEEELSACGDALISSAQIAARKKLSFTPKASDRDIDLDALSDRIISEFRDLNSHALKQSLEGNAFQVKGYLAVLKWLINNAASPKSSGGDADIQEALGIKGRVQEAWLVSEIERRVETAARHQEMKSENLNIAFDDNGDNDVKTLIRDYDASEKEHHDKAFSLLSRKSAKIKNTLVSDIETLIKEAEAITHLST
ncbi:hypothetical protein HWV62_39257 [Athelia sp. TMB]|nr:hypothetical protein HWV62_39257 [Athelia sp. TMB]